jgi:hypothetical protein
LLLQLNAAVGTGKNDTISKTKEEYA